MMMTEECWTNCFTQGSRRKSGEERGSEQMSKVKVVEAKIRKDKKRKKFSQLTNMSGEIYKDLFVPFFNTLSKTQSSLY